MVWVNHCLVQPGRADPLGGWSVGWSLLEAGCWILKSPRCPPAPAERGTNGAGGTTALHVRMASTPEDDTLIGAERFQPDRRSQADRRAAPLGISSDDGSSDSRRRSERRHITTERFMPADTAAVNGMVANAKSSVSCPACQGSLMLGPPMERGGIVGRRVECVDCHRVAMIEAKTQA